MRLLVFNPNTNGALTEELVTRARECLAPHEVKGLTAASGARYIADAQGMAQARAAALESLTRGRVNAYDAVLLACFGDPGLDVLKQRLHRPVFGLAECAFAEALRRFGRFGVVTGGQDWPPLIRDLTDKTGYGAALVDVRAIEFFGEAARANPNRTLHALHHEAQTLIVRHGPIGIVLGGTGLAPWADPLSALLGFPVLCSWRAGLDRVVEHFGS